MKFTKMEATGNDFVLVEAHEERDWPRLAVAMCHRHLGVGGDGLILVTPSQHADVGMRMLNPDGSEAEACGNGLRCLAVYAVTHGLASGDELTVETMAGTRRAHVTREGGAVTGARVGMGVPGFGAWQIPMLVSDDIDITIGFPLAVAGQELSVSCLSMGNPHAVHFTPGPVEEFPLSQVGPEVEDHPLFLNRTNFEVATIASRKEIQARVWERGAGETLSCGSGACAIAVAARCLGLAESPVDVVLPGGTLTIEWAGAGEVVLQGAAGLVFRGEWPGDG